MEREKPDWERYAEEIKDGKEPEIMRLFYYEHLPKHLQEVSRIFYYTANYIVAELPQNAEAYFALRDLLRAKDCAVRAKVLG